MRSARVTPSNFVIKAQSDMLFVTDRATVEVVRASTLGTEACSGEDRRPLGSWMLAFAEFFCTKKQYEHLIEAMIADLRYEHAEALAEGRRLKAAWLRFLYFFKFLEGTGLLALSKLVALAKALLSMLS